MSGLPVEQAYRLADRPEEQRWLVTGLWSELGVGLVGGYQKGPIMERIPPSPLIFLEITLPELLIMGHLSFTMSPAMSEAPDLSSSEAVCPVATTQMPVRELFVSSRDSLARKYSWCRGAHGLKSCG